MSYKEKMRQSWQMVIIFVVSGAMFICVDYMIPIWPVLALGLGMTAFGVGCSMGFLIGRMYDLQTDLKLAHRLICVAIVVGMINSALSGYRFNVTRESDHIMWFMVAVVFTIVIMPGIAAFFVASHKKKFGVVDCENRRMPC